MKFFVDFLVTKPTLAALSFIRRNPVLVLCIWIAWMLLPPLTVIISKVSVTLADKFQRNKWLMVLAASVLSIFAPVLGAILFWKILLDMFRAQPDFLN